IERLQGELAAKGEIVAKLQADVDEQQRKLAKLRGSESETMRLKAVSEQDKSTIDALQREIAQLREALARKAAEGTAEDERIKERDRTISRLSKTVKDHEATIAKLNESVESWRRKYQFLATEAPDAYKTAAEQ